MFSFTPQNIISYREGHVINDIVCNLGCCCPSQDTEEVFSYIEVITADGNRHFFYEDEKGFSRFEDDFHERRFTSFHEFWTTDTPAVENRDLFSFKYYVRRTFDSYTKMPLSDVRAQLDGCKKCKDRITNFHQYDRTVNYHD